MRLICLIRLCIILVCCSACASGPAPERSPKHIRQSLRFLNKGAVLYAKGCYPKALERFHEAHERYTAADHLKGVAASLNSIANVYFRLNDLDSALAVYNEAIELFRMLDDRQGLVRALSNKGAVLVAAGQFDAGEALFDEADAVAGKTGMLQLLRAKNRVILMMQRNQIDAAKDILRSAIDRSQPPPQEPSASAHYTMGRLLLSEGDPGGAVQPFSLALEMDRANTAYHGMALDLGALGKCYEEMGQPQQAVTFYRRSLKIFALLDDRHQVDEVRRSLEEVAVQSGADIRATLHWVEQWRKGAKEANLCR